MIISFSTEMLHLSLWLINISKSGCVKTGNQTEPEGKDGKKGESHMREESAFN